MKTTEFQLYDPRSGSVSTLPASISTENEAIEYVRKAIEKKNVSLRDSDKHLIKVTREPVWAFGEYPPRLHEYDPRETKPRG